MTQVHTDFALLCDSQCEYHINFAFYNRIPHLFEAVFSQLEFDTQLLSNRLPEFDAETFPAPIRRLDIERRRIYNTH